MTIDNLLKELDNNKVEIEVLPPRDDEDAPIKATVSLRERKEIIQKYLEGKEKRDIAREYGLPTRSVSLLIEKNQDLRLETEKAYQATALARENYRLSETKNKLLTFVDDTLEHLRENPEEMTVEAKMKIMAGVAALFDKLSITSRLNAEKPTSIEESRTLNLDVAKVLEQLPTPEDKLAFLKKQGASSKINEPIEYDNPGTTDRTAKQEN